MRPYTVYYISTDCSTCFGRLFHPSSGAHITVITASGTGQTVFATFRYRDEVRTKLLFHPSSGAHITVITASGTGQTVSASFRYRDEFRTKFQLRHDSRR